MKLAIKLLLVSLFLINCAVFKANASPVETYQFNDETTKLRYQDLVQELRCPKCQNQNLADSNSQIAIDLRRQVYQMLQQGKSDQEIVQFMVERYGDFVLYRPPLSSLTYLLWFGPFVLLFIGAVVVLVMVRKKKQLNDGVTLNAEQEAKLAELIGNPADSLSSNDTSDNK